MRRLALDLEPQRPYPASMIERSNLSLLSVCLFVALCLGCDGKSSDASSGQGMKTLSFGSDETLDLLTWNIESFPKDEARTPEYVVDTLRMLKPDVVAIQEVWSQAHLEWVARTLGSYRVEVVRGDEATGLAFLYNEDTVTLVSPAQTILRQVAYDFANRPPIQIDIEFRGNLLRLLNLHYKCCGDDVLGGDYWDEEVRRLRASGFLKGYLDRLPANDAVIVLGDWNDNLTDPGGINIFQPFLSQPELYHFVDLELAQNDNPESWSFPSYPSHLDHILINRPLFDAFSKEASKVATLRVEESLPNGFWELYTYLSDHRPVGLSLDLGTP